MGADAHSRIVVHFEMATLRLRGSDLERAGRTIKGVKRLQSPLAWIKLRVIAFLAAEALGKQAHPSPSAAQPAP